MTNVQGMVASGWEAVRDAFEANFTDRGDVGAGVAVVHDGQLVVDLVGGHRDAERTVAYTPDTLQLVFSTTKGMTAVCVALCVERGWISPATRVQELWPELQADVTVEQLMSHQAGLITIEPPLALEAALDLAAVTKGLEGTTPDWEPGTAHGYHAITYGWLAGELVRRADPQRRTLGRFFADEVARPLALEAWIGLPSSEESRVAPMIAAEPITDPAVLGLMEMMMGPTTRGGRALSLSGTFGQFGASSGTQMPWNTPAVRAAEIGAANGITNARSLARMYAATVGTVDGVRLLAADTVEMARAPRVKGPDACLLVETAFGLGFMLDSPFNPMLAPGSFGHPGAGGSVAFADPEAGIGFGYVMNQMQNNLSADPRQGALIEAVRSCL